MTRGTRVAVITGASRGLGEALAGFLAAQGWELILTARHPFTAPPGAIVIEGDVADPSHRAAVAAAVANRGVDILVNNASDLGVTPLLPLTAYPLDDLRRVLEVNVVGPLALVQDLLPHLRPGAVIVNISSDAARGGYEGWGAYGASKAALDLVSLTLAAELRATGIAVVAVDPGDMRTQMHQDAFPGEDISDRPLPDVTLPFFAWLLAQEPSAVSGQRLEAQGDQWPVTVPSSSGAGAAGL